MSRRLDDNDILSFGNFAFAPRDGQFRDIEKFNLTIPKTQRRVRVGQLQMVRGGWEFPCGHGRLWPAKDLPRGTREPGTYIVKCVERCVHYLFVHEPHYCTGAIPCEWDDEAAFWQDLRTKRARRAAGAMGRIVLETVQEPPPPARVSAANGYVVGQPTSSPTPPLGFLAGWLVGLGAMVASAQSGSHEPPTTPNA